MARIDLNRVAKARRRVDEATDELRASILAAVASGETYTDIAKMAGLSKSRVGQLVQESRTKPE